MRRQRGFSLLELLVTLVVVVVLVSLATLGTGSGAGSRRLAEAVRHLEAVAAHARDEAAFSGRDFGLLLEREDRDGEALTVARWRELGDTGWRRPRGGAAAFDPLDFPPGIAVELTLEGAPVVIDGGGRTGGDAGRAPQVIFYASGETTPGSLTWRRADTGEFLWRTRWDLLGRLETSDDPLETGGA